MNSKIKCLQTTPDQTYLEKKKNIFHKKISGIFFLLFLFCLSTKLAQFPKIFHISLRHCLLSIEFTIAMVMPRQPKTKNQMDIFEIFSIIGFLSKQKYFIKTENLLRKSTGCCRFYFFFKTIFICVIKLNSLNRQKKRF